MPITEPLQRTTIDDARARDTSAALMEAEAQVPLRWWRATNTRLNLLVALGMLVLALIFVSPGLPPLRVAAPMDQLLDYPPWQPHYPDAQPRSNGGDLILQELPWRHWAQQELAAGRFPLWASSPVGGQPLFASMQPAVLYPLNLLWVLMPVGVGLAINMALRLWLAGLGMWFFLRALSFRPAASLLSAVGFMFSTWLVDLSTWPHSNVYITLPGWRW